MTIYHRRQTFKNICQYYIFCLLIFTGVCSASDCSRNAYIKDAGPLVQTDSGTVIGKYITVINTEIAAFFGIPFAKPPLGEKRFLKAEPIEPWKGKLFATEKPPACIQHVTRNFDWEAPELKKSEDCLYLNIWSPTKKCGSDDRLPVLVWIHGGGFYSGSSSMESYDGGVLSSYGEVVVVSINYRLGVFGFLNVGTSDAPGNVGLFDQVLALQWIKENVKYFGGDPKSITLFGQSSGSMSISMHIVSSKSQNLFHKAILQSGTGYQPQLVEHVSVSQFKANTFAKILGCATDSSNSQNCPHDVVQCLKKKSPEELAVTENLFTSKLPLFFVPSYGNKCHECSEFFVESPIKSMESGKFNDVPIMIGSNQNESSIFLSFVMPEIFKLDAKPTLTKPLAMEIIKGLFSVAPAIPSDKVFEFYFKHITEDSSDDIIKAISDAYGDYIFNCPSMFFAEKFKESYYYWFTHRSITYPNHEWLGVTHLTEIPFVFGKPIAEPNVCCPEDNKLSEELIQNYIYFARTGYPLSKNSKQTWPKFSSDHSTYELNPNTSSVLPFPRLEACEFWRPFFEQQSS